MNSGAEELLRLEEQLDREVMALPIASAPIRSLIARIHLILDRLSHGDQEAGMEGGAARGEELGVRLSGLRPLLPRLSTRVQSSAVEALRDYELLDPNGTQIDLLLAYCQLWELLPEVRRGYLHVSGSAESGFTLSHPDSEFAHYEVRDTLLMSLAAPALLAQPNTDDREVTSVMQTRLLATFFEKAINEEALLDDSTFRLAAGIDRDAFERLRGACLALAHISRQRAIALWRRFYRGEIEEQELEPAIEWTSQCWDRSDLCRWLATCAEVEEREADRLIELFGLSLEDDPSRWPQVRDGYLPPFLSVGDQVLTGPDVLKLSLLERNLLFTVKWRDPRHFDNVVSRQLEPKLLDAVEPWFARLGNATAREVRWEGGEIDLLVYDETAHAALHVQAKASLSPNGARMTAGTEARMREGLEQHQRFSMLPSEQQVRILSQALGRDLSGVSIFDVLLTRSCLGTAGIWRDCSERGVTVLNPALLRLIVTGKPRIAVSAADLPLTVEKLLDQIALEIGATWREETMKVGRLSISLPALEQDPAAVERWRLAAATAV